MFFKFSICRALKKLCQNAAYSQCLKMHEVRLSIFSKQTVALLINLRHHCSGKLHLILILSLKRILLRVKLLYFLRHEVIGKLGPKIKEGCSARFVNLDS